MSTVHLERGTRLADLTTLRLGGPARELTRPVTQAQLVQTVRALDRSGVPLLVVGGGSNLVVSDQGFDGTVVLVRTRGVRRDHGANGSLELTVEAGEPWDPLVASTVADGFGGIAALSGIPGLTGATPIQNVGAYGQEVSSVLTSVRVLDRRTGDVRELTGSECGFGYRDSRFKRDDRYVVLAVTLRLTAGDQPVRYAELARTLGVEVGAPAEPARVRAAVLGLRRSKGMVIDAEPDSESGTESGKARVDPDTRSAGSFFTNPVLSAGSAELAALPSGAPRYPAPDGLVKVSAAWLIEQSGFAKGYGHGDARISSKHTLALTNRGSATTADLLALAAEIVVGVRERFGISLTPEPVLVGSTLQVIAPPA